MAFNQVSIVYLPKEIHFAWQNVSLEKLNSDRLVKQREELCLYKLMGNDGPGRRVTSFGGKPVF